MQYPVCCLGRKKEPPSSLRISLDVYSAGCRSHACSSISGTLMRSECALVSMRRSRSSSSGDTVPTRSSTGEVSCPAMAAYSPMMLFAWNGRRPEASWNKHTPRAHTSAGGPRYGCSVVCSGARYAGVPAGRFVTHQSNGGVVEGSKREAQPRSATLTVRPCGPPSSKLPSLMSPCTTPRACRWPSPRAAPSMVAARRASSRTPSTRKLAAVRSPPVAASITTCAPPSGCNGSFKMTS
mmetsp:Transcript_9638/g.24540  ORF Transcript_9638/g.24540 Transcript_9638/m.24540 type:complete len:238 (+) Transcript_9638:273-986(+)